MSSLVTNVRAFLSPRSPAIVATVVLLFVVGMVQAATTISTSITTGGDLTVTGTASTTLFSATKISYFGGTATSTFSTAGVLTAVGNTSLVTASSTGAISVAGAFWVGGNATTTAAGAISTESTLTVGAAATLSSTLGVTGVTTLTGTTTVGTAARFAVGTTTAISGAGLLVEDQVGTTTAAFSAAAASKGARLILEDHDGAGCTEVVALNGVLTAKIATCPAGI